MQQIANATCLFLIKPWKLSSVLLFGYCFRLRCRAKNELKFSKIRFLAEGNFQYGRNVEFTLSTYFILLQFFFFSWLSSFSRLCLSYEISGMFLGFCCAQSAGKITRTVQLVLVLLIIGCKTGARFLGQSLIA